MDFKSSSFKLSGMYDVLISFSGEDIQRKFVSHLDSALSAVGFSTFLHHQNAVYPTHIQHPIINLCRVAIVVFTKTYSESAWCLNQLQQIIKWQETYCRHVLPVYYEIEPSDVRLQKGDFGKALKATAQQTFSGEQDEDGMSRWSHALSKAANLFGWDESYYRSDAELVDKIVKSVRNLSVLSATKFPVGLQSRVEDLIRNIENKSTEVYTIAIIGEGGSGKTTLAKAIYNQLSGTFTEKSFIEDIGQVSATRWDIRLEERLASDVLKTKLPRSQIRHRLSGKRLLVVLDDVTDHGLLLNLSSCFSGGTVIIITTREERLLKIYPVDFVFPIKLMNEDESLELLSWHAFREAKPKEEYNDLAKGVAAYCGGLPLALEVIGSSLFERTKEEWNIALFTLAKIPHHDVEQKLKICFNSLCSEMEKDLFLDVCCFFVGKGRAYVTKILNGCGVDADSGIRVLMERNLIKVKKKNKLGIHALLQEMGITIIFEISGKKRGKNSRLWFDKDAEYVLTGTRFLGFETYPHNKFYVHNAIAIDLKHSFLPLSKEPQVLRWLKVLNLSHSTNLIETPDFSSVPKLEHLILKDCPRLCRVHQSIVCLFNLTLLNLKDCRSLSNLPGEVYKLKSLKTLILSGCSMIDPLKKDIEPAPRVHVDGVLEVRNWVVTHVSELPRMESLITLIAENTAVKEVPFSIVRSQGIGYISLHGFERLPRNLFPSIIRSWMTQTTNPISYIHAFCMDMENNSWDDITPLLSSLANLRSVLVQCETEFQLSMQVENILVEYFTTITKSGTSKQQFRSSWIGVGAYHEFFKAVSDNIYEVSESSELCDVSLREDNDPYWLAYKGDGHSVSFTVPPDRHIKGLALCVVYLSTLEVIEPEFISVLIVNYTKCTLYIHKPGTIIFFNDEDWDGIMSNLGSGDKVEIFVNFGHRLVVVKNTTVYLICSESNNLEKEPNDLEQEPNDVEQEPNDLEQEPVPKQNALVRFIKKFVM